ncbi:DEAD/DEAH box helicase [Microcella putealis]
MGDPAVTPMNVASDTWQRWRDELAALGGASPLLHFDDDPRGRIELGTSHPGGLARFIAGSPTLLSNLVRDDVALRTARVAAERIADKGLELSSVRGIDAIALGIGMVVWSHGGETFRAPLLLRPLRLRRRGREVELTLLDRLVLNPALARELARQFSLHLDEEAFVALADDDGTFKPNPPLDRLRGLTAHLDGFTITPRLVVSTFAEVGPALAADARDLSHPVLDAIAGNTSARWAVQESQTTVTPVPADQRPPETDLLLLDADAEQEDVIANVAAGNSIVVKTLPGTGATQTVVNALGTLIAQNKRVLVVSSRRAALSSIQRRFTDIGLPGVTVTPRSLRRDVIRGISRNEKAQKPRVADVNEALVRLRGVLLDYREALGRPDPKLGISVYDCVSELSRLALLPTPPTTRARLTRAAVETLAHDRAHAAQVIVQAAKLGQFSYGPGDSPWYGAEFSTGEEATRAQERARRLHSELVPRLLDRAVALVAATPMRQFETLAELGTYLRLLTELRDTLDKFQPSVFDRSLSELIAATAPRREGSTMPATTRRRLKALAKEYVRPGVHVSDLHDALTRIQQQRILWQRFAPVGITPTVPVGIADVAVAYQQVEQDLEALDAPLGHTTREKHLLNRRIDELQRTLAGLAAESDVLANLQERTELMREMQPWGLDALLDDLAQRHVPHEQVAAELELAWWRSALDSLLQADRALLGADVDVLDRLESDFRLVDEAHAAGSAAMMAWQLSEAWSIGITDWPDEAKALRDLLRSGMLTPGDLQKCAPHLSRPIAPIWLSSPYDVAEISDDIPFDAVFVLDAGAVTMAEVSTAIRRGRQVVAIGDPVTQTPSPFSIAVSDAPPTASDEEARHASSALVQLSELLPTLGLTRSYRAGGEDLAELVNRRFYAGRIDSLPWAGSFLGHPSIAVDYLDDGNGMPDDVTGTIESVDAEVDQVVTRVLEHATARPNESLMVITASAKHAARVQTATLNAMQSRPDLHDFFLGDRAEPFAVLTIEQAVAQSRDRVIFSIGFGRTPHGRVLSEFGALGRPGGDRLLAVAMTRARRFVRIVSCIRADDLDDDRMGPGARALAELLADTEARRTAVDVPDDSDPMLIDLARRLEARGLRTALGHRGKLKLVASRGGYCIAVDTDASLGTMSLRESLRLRPDLLRRLGWHYARVHVFELFSNPDAVADRIAAMAKPVAVQAPPAPTPAPTPAAAAAAPARPTAAPAETQPIDREASTGPIAVQSAAPAAPAAPSPAQRAQSAQSETQPLF